ncbi:hypothetical protein EBZ70_04500 [bacterium]|nr:hypothetical protein [bacterium]
MKSLHYPRLLVNTRKLASASSVFLPFLILSPKLSAATIQKANNSTVLSTGSSWTGGSAPTSSDLAGFSSAISASGATTTIGTGVSFAGILFSSNPANNIVINAGTAGTLALGSSGIDLNGSTRSLTIGSTVSLGANQTWKTGSATSNTTQLSVTGLISGSGALTLAGAASPTNQAVFLSNAGNTFSGGVTLSSGGALRISSAAATVASGAVTASAIGTGSMTINGGTIFSAGGSIASNVTVNSDFTVNVGTVANNGRFTANGGTWDLSGSTRTVSLGRYAAASSVIVGGFESFRFNLLTNAPAILIQNGNLRFVRETSLSPAATDYSNITFGTAVNFASGAGFTVGDHVLTTFSTGNPFGTTAGAQPTVTVESGGYFNLSDATNSRSPTIRSLSGAGKVTNFSSATGTSTLSINPVYGDSTTFSGNIADGSANTSVIAASVGSIAITKTGAGTQIFSGSNAYTGPTTISAGKLLINGTHTVGSGVTGAYNVTGGILGGTGTVDLSASNLGVTVANGAQLEANSADGLSFILGSGTLNLSAALASATPSMLFTLGAPGGSVITASSASIGSGALNFDDFSFTKGEGFGPGAYVLFNLTSISGTLGSSLTGTVDGLNSTIGLSDNNIILTVASAIPEPSAYSAVLGLGGIALAATRRRRPMV